MPKSNSTDMSQGGIAYARLLDAIRSGVFQPHDRLREEDVAARLSLSRTPVREALRKLEADGIVEHRPRLGAVVRALSRTEVVELYEMRLVLERTAAEMAAKHAIAAEIDELEDLNAEIAKALNAPAQAASINQQFHRCIYLATRNRFLLESARALNNALMLLGPTTLADEARISIVCKQHQDIIDAIRNGDVEAAGASAEAHLQTSLRHRLEVMRG
ncbi:MULTISPECIES: GntR family transcriptional regulator [Pacificibacter]|uniref:GntR family transcriptional regulator n=1 Tax=Pacificibacter TaxID=1042323 RepID=UPI001C0A4E42|nr:MULTISPECIES: GntR family transcriptional regulator [Pacificibacter]MBU2936441.1 GntR family transcriptional regulator [Pacificibacter marinus]MDO6616589.1 GntR family transcriptional regulator [Pacificibacter sp. 1_MG-2023]